MFAPSEPPNAGVSVVADAATTTQLDNVPVPAAVTTFSNRSRATIERSDGPAIQLTEGFVPISNIND